MSGFVVQDSIKVLTQNGECQIDLCLGDITKLQRKDKVDVIVVSAFQNDYVPTRTSVIRALKYNLGLSVGELSRNKADDLRRLYSCWWSHPLPDKMPYGRLLCFETNHRSLGRPQEMVANVYRCLVPILNNEDGTVITSLLNTGDQGYGKLSMLQGMVVAAVNWMKAGLPLRLLKIVLYARDIVETIGRGNFRDVCGKFAELKERYDSQYLVPKAVPIEFDIYLSYSEDDQKAVAVIQDGLKSIKSDIRIYGNKQKIDSEAVWQQDMYQAMIRSARVVTVLSPHYLNSTACIEQYNIALCCNRRAHRDMLAPFYVNSIDLMPTYMGLVQYVDWKAWQRTLYHSIDGSRCLLALISENYIKSPVCQEEYNLALAKHCSMDGSMKLIPLCLEDLQEVPVTFGKVKMVKATPDVFDSVSNAVCKAVVDWLVADGKDKDVEVQQILESDQNHTCNMDKVSENQRRADFISKYGTEDKKLLSLDKRFPTKLKDLIQSRPASAMSRSGDGPDGVDIVVSCAPEDWKYAGFLRAVLQDAAPSLVVKSGIKSEKERLTLMDTARCVVPFVTPSYLDSPEQVEEFHIALCRQRNNPSTVLFPIIVHPVPPKPTYFRLVPCSVNIADAMWSELAHKWNVNVPGFHHPLSDTTGIELPSEVMLGLHEAAGILISELNKDENSGAAATDVPYSRPVLHNILKIKDEITDDSEDRSSVVKINDELLVTLNFTNQDVAEVTGIEPAKPPLQNDTDSTPEETTEDSNSDKPVANESNLNSETAKLDMQSPAVRVEENQSGSNSNSDHGQFNADGERFTDRRTSNDHQSEDSESQNSGDGIRTNHSQSFTEQEIEESKKRDEQQHSQRRQPQSGLCALV